MTFLTALAAGALLLPVVAFGAAQAPSDDLVPATVVSQASSPSTPALNTIAPEAVTRSETEVEQTPIGRWAWPLTPLPQVVRRFAVGPAPWSPGHRGVDLAPKSESLATVRAPANGVVHFAGMLAGRPVLSIAHGDGLISSFEPVVSTLRRGQVVHRDSHPRLSN